MTQTRRRRRSKTTRRRTRGDSRVEKKQCARCLEKKPLDKFGENPRMAQGRKSYCLECSAELQSIWRRDQRQAEKSKRKR